MRSIVFVTIIIASGAFFGLFTILDGIFIHDLNLELVYESVILTITLALVGIAVAKFYADETTDSVISEVKRIESDLKQRLDNLESEKDRQKTNE